MDLHAVRKRIGYKLIFALALVTVPAIAGLSYFMIQAQSRDLIEQLKQQTDELSETVKSSTKSDMLVKHRAHLHRVIKDIGAQEGIDRIRIFNKEGEVIFSTHEDEIGQMVDKRAEACYACHAADRPLEKVAMSERARFFTKDKARHLGIINPIYNERSCWEASCHAHTEDQRVLGVLDFTMSLKQVDRQMRASRQRMVLFAVAVIALVGVLLAFLVQRLVSEPVDRLLRATSVIAAGDLSHRVPVVGSDELGNLARSFNEMTEKLAEVQRQLFHQDKLASIGRLVAGIAHEINNPLTGILTFSSLALKRAAPESEEQRELEVVVRETKRCRDLVKRLLDFSRQVPVAKTDIDLNAVIESSLSILNNQLMLTGISVKLNLGPGLPPVYANANRLQQVFINLVVNALDAMEQAQIKELTLSSAAANKDGRWTLTAEIADTGSGIEPAEIHKIFEPFYSTKGQKGTGLGLSVVWGIIEEHNGRIAAKSSGAGKGTIFTVELPASRPPGEKNGEKPAEEPPA